MSAKSRSPRPSRLRDRDLPYFGHSPERYPEHIATFALPSLRTALPSLCPALPSLCPALLLSCTMDRGVSLPLVDRYAAILPWSRASGHFDVLSMIPGVGQR